MNIIWYVLHSIYTVGNSKNGNPYVQCNIYVDNKKMCKKIIGGGLS